MINLLNQKESVSVSVSHFIFIRDVKFDCSCQSTVHIKSLLALVPQYYTVHIQY